MTYANPSKGFPKRSYFCGWYYRCQSDDQTLAIIPSVHKTKDAKFCTIQLITDTQAFYAQFPYSDFQENDDQIRIGNNRFGKSGISLDIHTPEFHSALSHRSSMILWDRFNLFRSCSAGTAFTVCITG